MLALEVYQDVAGNLRVKEVRISEHERFVICHNPEAADRDATIRTQLLARLEELIASSDELSTTKRAELRGVISTKPDLNRYLRVTAGGLLRLDAKAIAAETKLDGKYLLRTNEPHLSAEDVALGYKQLLEVERGWSRNASPGHLHRPRWDLPADHPAHPGPEDHPRPPQTCPTTAGHRTHHPRLNPRHPARTPD